MVRSAVDEAVAGVGEEAGLEVPEALVAREAERVREVGGRARRRLHGGLERGEDGGEERQDHDGADRDADRRREVVPAVAPPAERQLADEGVRARPVAHCARPAREGDLHHRQDEDEEREDERQRRAVAELQVGEGVEVDEEDRGGGHVARLAGGHDVELVEGEERADGADQGDEEDGAGGQRQGDVAGARPVAGAVDLGGVLHLVGDGVDRGDEEEHAEAEHLPDDRDDDRPERGVGVGAEPEHGLGR